MDRDLANWNLGMADAESGSLAALGRSRDYYDGYDYAYAVNYEYIGALPEFAGEGDLTQLLLTPNQGNNIVDKIAGSELRWSQRDRPGQLWGLEFERPAVHYFLHIPYTGWVGNQHSGLSTGPCKLYQVAFVESLDNAIHHFLCFSKPQFFKPSEECKLIRCSAIH